MGHLAPLLGNSSVEYSERRGFEGFVVSDYGSIKMLETFHNVSADEKEAAIQALEAGIDIELLNVMCMGNRSSKP